MSEQDKTPPKPTVKLPKGARLTRHGNIIQDGTQKVKEEDQ